MDVTTISAAVSSLKAAKDIAQGMLYLKTEAEIQSRVIDLQSLILQAQGKALEAQAEQFELARQLAEAKAALESLSDQKSFIATLERKSLLYFAPGDPDPLCPRCVEVDSRAIHLKKTSKLELAVRVWACPQCKAEYMWRQSQ